MDCYDQTLSCAARRMPEQRGNTGDGRHEVFGGEDSTSRARHLQGTQVSTENDCAKIKGLKHRQWNCWHSGDICYVGGISQDIRASRASLASLPASHQATHPLKYLSYDPGDHLHTWPGIFFSLRYFLLSAAKDRCYLSHWYEYLSLSTTGSSIYSNRNCKALRPPHSFVSWLFLPSSRSISPLPAPCTSIRECSSRAQQAQRLSS